MELIVTEKNQWWFYALPKVIKKNTIPAYVLLSVQNIEIWVIFLKALLEIHFANVKDDI